MKRKGFTNLIIVVGIMLFSMALISIFGFPLINSYFRTTKAINLVEPYVESMNGLERLYGKFYENISYNETTTYSDLNKIYTVIDKQLDNRPISLTVSGDSNTAFKILNKTDINITINYSPSAGLLPGDPTYYNVEIFCAGTSIYNSTNISSGKSITIPSDFLYDKTTGISNYGEYKLIINSVNSDINTNIAYNEQSYRKIEITENTDIKRTLVIENNTSIDGTIKRYLVKN